MSISLSSDLCCFSLSLFDNLSLDKFGLSNNLIVLKLSFGVDLVNKSITLSILFTSKSRNWCFNIFNFLLFVQLIQNSLLLSIFSFFQMNLSGFFLLFFIITDSLIECKSFSLKSGLKLINCGLLHVIGDVLIQSDACDHHSFDQNALVGQIWIQKFKHSICVSLSSQIVGFSRLHSSCQGSYFFHDISIN